MVMQGAGGPSSLAAAADLIASAKNPGKFHDQGDARWIVIRGQVRGHNDTPLGRPNPGCPIGRQNFFLIKKRKTFNALQSHLHNAVLVKDVVLLDFQA
jgi:hypothetical protein